MCYCFLTVIFSYLLCIIFYCFFCLFYFFFFFFFFLIFFFFFFFQAEDGIRDADVTGDQTCALPIWQYSRGGLLNKPEDLKRLDAIEIQLGQGAQAAAPVFQPSRFIGEELRKLTNLPEGKPSKEIGRASCRERGEL